MIYNVGWSVVRLFFIAREKEELLQRRLEGVSTLLTLAVNVYIIYDLTFYLIIATVYFLYIFKNGASAVDNRVRYMGWYFFVLALPIIYVYQILATLNFFAKPLFTRNAQIYEEKGYGSRTTEP